MKTLIFNNQNFRAEKITKTSNSIVGYSGNTEVFSFRGISNFSLFALEVGQNYDLSETEQIRLEMARSNAEMFEMMIAMLGGGL